MCMHWDMFQSSRRICLGKCRYHGMMDCIVKAASCVQVTRIWAAMAASHADRFMADWQKFSFKGLYVLVC